MRILQAINLHYHPANSGVTKINRRVLERLVELGHTVLTVVPALPVPSPITLDELLADLVSLGVRVHRQSGVGTYRLRGVDVVALENRAHFRPVLTEWLHSFQPDWVMVSSEDPSQTLLSTALKVCPGQVVYVANTTSMLPFGPHSFFPSAKRTALLKRVRAIISVSRYLSGYLMDHAGLKSTTIYPPVHDPGPFANVARFESEFVTMVNPSRVKGISIFLAVAKAMPNVKFAAVPSWATTTEDLRALGTLSNVTVLDRNIHIDEVYARTRVLLVPSLWAEALSMLPTEAMLRGIPVLASDIGGLPESKAGTDYLLPVAPSLGYEPQLDDQFVPIPRIPPQDVTPWLSALRELLADRSFYECQSAAARVAANEYCASTGVEVLEKFLNEL